MKVCFVGAGSIGKRHIRNLSEICKNKNEELKIHLLRSSKTPLQDNSIRNLISKEVFSPAAMDDNYDAIFITNPTFRHLDTLSELIDHTDNFFIEKPVFDRTDIDIDYFLDTHKKFYIACPLRHTEILKSVQQFIKNEKVLSVRAISSSYLPDWRCGTDYRKTYSAHKEQGGGVRIDLIHEWDYLVSLFGYPQEIYSLSGKISDLEIDSEDIAVYIARCANTIVELHLDYFGHVTRRYLEIRTSEHEYLFDIVKNEILEDGTTIKVFQEEANYKYLSEMNYFYNLIKGNSENINDLKMAMETLRIAKEC